MRRSEASLTVLGMMTGTSCDGLDAVAVRFRSRHFTICQRWSRPYPNELRKRVFLFQQPGSKHDSRTWLALGRDLGKWYAQAADSFIRSANQRIDVIANHGQTLAHFPGTGTLQMGDPAYIAERTKLTIVSQFRTGDMAAGGQGAPLVPRFHQLLAQNAGIAQNGVAIHNLGGISNLTYIDHDEVLAWDTGPGNLWIDLAVSIASKGRFKMDEGGRLAAIGNPDLDRVKRLLLHPYFKRKAPKSTGRDEFTKTELSRILGRLSLADAAATATLATARSIAQDYCRQLLARRRRLEAIYFCGGGAKNFTLLECIRIELLRNGWLVPIFSSSELGVDPQDMEAAAFAFLGKEALLGNALGGSWTGARKFGPPAQITPGLNWNQLIKKVSELF